MYNYSRFTQYAYLIAGLLFAFHAFQTYREGQTNQAFISVGFTIMALFMFFFRRSFAKKFDDHNKKP